VPEPAVAVSVEVSEVEAVVKSSEEDEKSLQVGSPELVAPDGLVVTAQLRVTVPVNELPAVTVIVLVLVEAAATAMLPLFASEKLVLSLFGDCQKSPQPAKSTPTAIKPAQLLILIPAPCAAHQPRQMNSSR
jgi:hypothetical protein